MKRNLLAGLAFLVVGLILWILPSLRQQLAYPIFFLVFSYFAFFWITQATSWTILTGNTGYFSFGQGAFFGMGVYTTALLLEKTTIGFLGSLPVAGLTATVLALLVGFITFRLRKLRGEIFGLLTLAVAFILASIARITPFIDGGQGVPLSGAALPQFLGRFPDMMFRLGLLLMLASLYGAYLIQNSRLGWGLFAIRDDEEVAEGLGVPTFRYKMIALGISGFIAGLSGGLHSIQISYVTVEDVFNIRVPLFVILMSILGGRRHWLGPVFGALVIFTLTDRFNSAGFENFNQIVIGILLIIIILFLKEGIYPRLRQRAWPALLLFVLVLWIQNAADIGRLAIDRAAFAGLATLLLLLVPDRLYALIPWPGRRRLAPGA